MKNSNNHIILSGRIIEPLEFSHSVRDEEFYTTTVEISRLSEVKDCIKVTIPNRLKDKIELNKHYTLCGQLRSHNKVFDNKTSLLLRVFVKEAFESHVCVCQNEILLNGYICKQPIYRTTPFNRQICDILLAVNRNFNKSDYIPCITWGSNAFFASGLEVGKNIKIKGRLQSREYEKCDENGNKTTKIAYEVSVGQIEIIDKI